MFNYLFIILLQSVVTFLSLFEKGFCHILNTFLFSVSLLLHFGTFLTVFCHNFVFQSLMICLLSNYNLLSHFFQIFVNFCYILEIVGPHMRTSIDILPINYITGTPNSAYMDFRYMDFPAIWTIFGWSRMESIFIQ